MLSNKIDNNRGNDGNQIRQQESESLSPNIPLFFYYDWRRSVKDKIKELILKYLSLYNGSSPGYIVSKIMSEIGPMAFTNDEFHEAYEELLDDEEMISLDFTDHDSTRSKTILFMRGTKLINLGELVDGQKSTASQADVARAID